MESSAVIIPAQSFSWSFCSHFTTLDLKLMHVQISQVCGYWKRPVVVCAHAGKYDMPQACVYYCTEKLTPGM